MLHLLAPLALLSLSTGEPKVVRVTNLDADGPGSLRAALETEGFRAVVFEVGGVIDLEGKSLSISAPSVTVAGQTAPPPGITIIRGGLVIRTHDVLVQHLAIRPGDRGRPKKSGWEPDGITTTAGAHDVAIENCSLTWAVDENLSASGPRTEGPEATSHRITFGNCIIAEGLNDSTHAKGPHSKGTLIHDDCREIAIVGNLYAHNVQRNPLFKAFATGLVVNNVIYDPGSAAIHAGWVESEWAGTDVAPQGARFSVVGNVLRHGPSTRKGVALVRGRGDAFLADNLAFDREGNPVRLTADAIRVLDEKPWWPEGFEPLPAARTLEYVLAHAGARPRERDPIDARIVAQVRAGTGKVIDSQEEVGGYPERPATRRALDVPETGIAQWLLRLAKDLE